MEWLGEGGVREDDDSRFFRHFHDPLRPWASAGLLMIPFCSLRCESSIRWMQRTDQGWSWQEARRFYLTALTAATPAQREQAFADTFRALGQVMHLVVDASVPEHVRNDPHPKETICRELGIRCYGNYEYWVSDQHGRPVSPAEGAFIARFLSTPVGFDSSILGRPTGDAQAPVPVARLIDTDTYSRADPNVTLGPAIGIAEFANANFFSEDTGNVRLLGPNYPFPDRARLVPSQHPAPKTGRVRAYYAKGAGDGLAVDPALAECVLDQAARAEGVPLTTRCVDENVWEATATAMLPRAVGYARAALDYFFRGRLEVAFAENPADPGGSLLTVTNRSSDALAPGGTLAVFVDDTEGNRQPVPGATLSLTASIAPDTPVPPIPLPASAQAGRLTVVYRGPLGGEQDAVIGRIVAPLPVEQVFRGPDDWMLRTAEGIFPLGLGLGPNRVKWGDRDNTLVTAQWSQFRGVDAVFTAYRINRPEGSSTVPLRPDGRVDLVPLGSATFAGAPIDLQTTVTFARSTQVSQKIALIDCHVFSLFPPDGQCTGAGVQTLDLGTFPFTATVPLVLQLPDPSDDLYEWFFRDVSLTRDGDILATVPLFFVQPIERTPVPCWFRRGDGQLVLGGSCLTIFHDFPFPNLMVFVVNLTRRSVVAKSSDDGVAISYATKTELLDEDIHFISHTPGFTDTWRRVDSAGGLVTGPVVGEVTLSDGIIELTQSGFYRPELAGAGFAEHTLVDVSSTNDLALGPDVSIRLTRVGRLFCPTATFLHDIGRASGTDGDYTVVGSKFCQDGFSTTWVPIQWSPGAASVTRLAAIAASPENSFNATLTSASRSAAMVVVDEVDPVAVKRAQFTHLVTPQEDLVFPGDLSGRYRLLGPDLLFNTSEARFHRLTAALDPLPGPPLLAPGGPAAGEYHVIGQQ